ncbi:hypothetical protein AYI70_g8279 [Smittium culicis]|uniref:BHLH domain-containing protein n=1 Tax=Smittium culicis TaxID=133412 RepID=A0A1R1XGP9_9FUNG|nr:hypothetical protein AYI70_g8279 [Smittium culicis]
MNGNNGVKNNGIPRGRKNGQKAINAEYEKLPVNLLSLEQNNATSNFENGIDVLTSIMSDSKYQENHRNNKKDNQILENQHLETEPNLYKSIVNNSRNTKSSRNSFFKPQMGSFSPNLGMYIKPTLDYSFFSDVPNSAPLSVYSQKNMTEQLCTPNIGSNPSHIYNGYINSTQLGNIDLNALVGINNNKRSFDLSYQPPSEENSNKSIFNQRTEDFFSLYSRNCDNNSSNIGRIDVDTLINDIGSSYRYKNHTFPTNGCTVGTQNDSLISDKGFFGNNTALKVRAFSSHGVPGSREKTAIQSLNSTKNRQGRPFSVDLNLQNTENFTNISRNESIIQNDHVDNSSINLINRNFSEVDDSGNENINGDFSSINSRFSSRFNEINDSKNQYNVINKSYSLGSNSILNPKFDSFLETSLHTINNLQAPIHSEYDFENNSLEVKTSLPKTKNDPKNQKLGGKKGIKRKTVEIKVELEHEKNKRSVISEKGIKTKFGVRLQSSHRVDRQLAETTFKPIVFMRPKLGISNAENKSATQEKKKHKKRALIISKQNSSLDAKSSLSGKLANSGKIQNDTPLDCDIKSEFFDNSYNEKSDFDKESAVSAGISYIDSNSNILEKLEINDKIDDEHRLMINENEKNNLEKPLFCTESSDKVNKDISCEIQNDNVQESNISKIKTKKKRIMANGTLWQRISEQRRRDAMRENFDILKRMLPEQYSISDDGRDLARPVLLARCKDVYNY